MKPALRIVGLLSLLVGAVWLLQGVGVLPGSFMSGQRQWAINGAIALGVGIALLAVAQRLRPPGPPEST